MSTLLQDLRYGLRTLLKSPGFTAVAVLTLALGIGANTAIFSLINAVLLRPLPVRDPQRLAIVGNPAQVHSMSNGSPQTRLLSVPLYRELQREQDVFDGLVATGYLGPTAMVSLSDDGQTTPPERVAARMVSENFFDVLGVDAAMGRVFRSSENAAPGSNPVVVISYAYWKRRFHQDPSVVGRTLRLNGFPLTVIGVTPPQFTGEVVGDSLDLWVPLSMQPQVMAQGNILDDVEASWLVLIGRMKPGLSVLQVQARLQTTYEHIASSSFLARYRGSENQQTLKQNKLEVSSGARGLSALRRDFSHPLTLLMMIVALVLLIACVNVANLLLARSAARQKEIAVRLAIGGSPARIVRQLLTESVLLAFLGGALGLLFAQWGTHALLALARRGAAVPLATSPDASVLAFTSGVCLLAGILFGFAPALRAGRLQLSPALNSATRNDSASGVGPSRWGVGRLLVAAQVGLSVLVLFAAALLIQSLRNLQAIDTGYEREHLLIARIDPRLAGYKGASYMAFCDDLLRRIRALPGVVSATYSENGLFSGTESADGIVVPGFQPRQDEDRVAYNDTVGPNYFTAVGIPLLLGRDLGPQDMGAAEPKVAVINESMAKFYFGGLNPLGRSFSVPDEPKPAVNLEVIGVARDVRDHDLRHPVERRFYKPINGRQLPGAINFEVRVTGNVTPIQQALRSAVRDANPQVPVLRLQTVAALVNDWMDDQIFVARLSGVFAVLALLLACVGLYGITSYAVAGRTREIGVRIALGAHPRAVLWLVLREALLLVAVGLMVGVPAAVVGSRVLRSMLYEVSALDLRALLLPVGILATVGLASAYLPARRATHVDPMVALRYE